MDISGADCDAYIPPLAPVARRGSRGFPAAIDPAVGGFSAERVPLSVLQSIAACRFPTGCRRNPREFLALSKEQASRFLSRLRKVPFFAVLACILQSNTGVVNAL